MNIISYEDLDILVNNLFEIQFYRQPNINHHFNSYYPPPNALHVAKYNSGKVRLELMQSAVSPFMVHDLQAGPLEICRAFVSCCLSHALLLVDLCRSIALC